MSKFGLATIKAIYMKVLVYGGHDWLKQEITLNGYYKIYYVELMNDDEYWDLPLGYLRPED